MIVQRESEREIKKVRRKREYNEQDIMHDVRNNVRHSLGA